MNLKYENVKKNVWPYQTPPHLLYTTEEKKKKGILLIYIICDLGTVMFLATLQNYNLYRTNPRSTKT